MMITIYDVCGMIREQSPGTDLSVENADIASGTFGLTGNPIVIDFTGRNRGATRLYIEIYLDEVGHSTLTLTYFANEPYEVLHHAIGEFLRVCEELGSLR